MDTKATFFYNIKHKFFYLQRHCKKVYEINYYDYFVKIMTSKFRYELYTCERHVDRDFGTEGTRYSSREWTSRKKERGRKRVEEKIVESNIRRTFTVRFPNLYCVWQRCRDIRGSYRNVLLLIVLHPEGNRRPRTKGSSVPDGDGKSGERDDSRGREIEDSYIGERREGQKGGIFAKGRKRGKERRPGTGGSERESIERERAKDRERVEGKENDQGTQRALVLLTGRWIE